MSAATYSEVRETHKALGSVSLHGNALATLLCGQRALEIRVLVLASLVPVREDEHRALGFSWRRANPDLASARPCGSVDGSPVLDVLLGWTRKDGSLPAGTDRERFERWWLSGPGAPKRVSGNSKGDWYVSHPIEDAQDVRSLKGLPWFVRGNPWLVEIEYEAVEIAGHLHRVVCAPCA